jgi:hypothetical protein
MILLAALSIGTAHASGYVGIYEAIDKVVFEPDADHPQRVQVFGVFSLAQQGRPTEFQPAQRGYLYFKLPSDPAASAQAVREWSDFKAKAGSGEAVGFWTFGFTASQYEAMPKVRKDGDKPADPDVFQPGQGVSTVRKDTDYAPIRTLFNAH